MAGGIIGALEKVGEFLVKVGTKIGAKSAPAVGKTVITEAATKTATKAEPSILGKLWNAGRDGGFGENSLVAKVLGKWVVRAPVKTVGAVAVGSGVTDLAVNGVNPLDWKVTPRLARDGLDIITAQKTPAGVAVDEVGRGWNYVTTKIETPVQAQERIKAETAEKNRLAAARADAARRAVASRSAADRAANATLDGVLIQPAVAEVRGQSTWGKFVASINDAGERTIAYEVASRPGRETLLFRNGRGVEVKVQPSDNVFVVKDQGLLTPGGVKDAPVGLEIFRLNDDGTPRGQRFDAISVPAFPASTVPSATTPTKRPAALKVP